jgi:hypothetical protein
MNLYTKILKDQGYKVLRIPYHPFKIKMYEFITKGEERGDALILYKEDYQGYDAIVSNNFWAPEI